MPRPNPRSPPIRTSASSRSVRFSACRLLNQAKVIGVLYLENNLAPRVFAPARTAVLKLLASQAAISLENTHLVPRARGTRSQDPAPGRFQRHRYVIWDLDGRLIDANDAFLRMLRYEREDLNAGLRWFDMTPPEWQEVHARSELEELQTTGTMQAREKEYFRKDGSRVPVLIGAAAFEGQPDQGVAYILDLTDLKRAEEAGPRKRAQIPAGASGTGACEPRGDHGPDHGLDRP